MKRILLFAAIFAIGFSSVALPEVRAQQPATVWAVDFVKPKQGQFENYRKFLEANWVVAREEARRQGYIVSYKILVAAPLPDAEWDILLMTEYADRKMYDAREQSFQAVFKKIRGDKGPTLINGLGARDLADIKFSKLLDATK
jgi:hypothetical protein